MAIYFSRINRPSRRDQTGYRPSVSSDVQPPRYNVTVDGQTAPGGGLIQTDGAATLCSRWTPSRSLAIAGDGGDALWAEMMERGRTGSEMSDRIFNAVCTSGQVWPLGICRHCATLFAGMKAFGLSVAPRMRRFCFMKLNEPGWKCSD